jgi:hypothetical protein
LTNAVERFNASRNDPEEDLLTIFDMIESGLAAQLNETEEAAQLIAEVARRAPRVPEVFCYALEDEHPVEDWCLFARLLGRYAIAEEVGRRFPDLMDESDDRAFERAPRLQED